MSDGNGPRLEVAGEFGGFDGRAWLNCAHQGPLPLVAVAEAGPASVIVDAVRDFAAAGHPMALVTSTARTVNDSTFPAGDPRRLNGVADCDLASPLANGECGAMANQNFGRALGATVYDPAPPIFVLPPTPEIPQWASLPDAAGVSRAVLSWSGDANVAGEMYPDQSLYPVNSVPMVVKRINNTFQRADQIQWSEGKDDIDFFAGTAGAAAFQVLVDGVTACIAAGVARPGDPFLVATQVWSALHGAATLRRATTGFPWPPLEEQVRGILKAFTGIPYRNRSTAEEMTHDGAA